MKVISKILFLILINTITIFAQSNVDCISALEINVVDTIFFQGELPTAGVIDENITDFCGTNGFGIADFIESNAYWFHYEFSDSMDFIFTITPDNLTDDLDFIIFRSSSENCNELTPIRCMFSGETVGGSDNSICLGKTGLSRTSTDTVEDPGCNSGSDNFLAPINVVPGDNLYLVILSFSGSASYTISHEDMSEVTVNTKNIEKIKSAIYPNPSKESIKIKLPTNLSSNIAIEIYNMQGAQVQISENIGLKEIDISNLEIGSYVLKLVDMETRELLGVKKLIKK